MLDRHFRPAAMLYQEYPPPPALRAHVACLWHACTPPAAPGRQPAPRAFRVLPDNCVDILWQDGGAPAFAVGMMSKAIIVPAGMPQRTVAVRFHAGAAGAFLGIPLHGLADARASLDHFWGAGDTARLDDALWTHAMDDDARIALLAQALLARLRALQAAGSEKAATGTPLVAAALAAIDGQSGMVRIDGLAAALGVSRQHLATQFRQHVGLTPKLYARISRFRRATAALAAHHAHDAGKHPPDWAQLALACGYFDQSHLIHDFQEFAGSAPARFVAD